MMSANSLAHSLQPLIEALKQRHFDRAILGLKQFLSSHPDHELALGMLASAYVEIGMREAAQERYERLLEKYPGNTLARFQLGLLHLDTQPAQALSVWEPLLAVEQEFMAHFHSALANVQLGNLPAARPLLEHAARYMPPDHPLRDQLVQLRARLGASTSSNGYRP